MSGSEASLPSTHWDSGDEDAGGPSPRLMPPLDLAAFDKATQPADPYTLWRVDSSLSEGEVGWPQQTATRQDVGWARSQPTTTTYFPGRSLTDGVCLQGDEPGSMGMGAGAFGGSVPGAGYESDGEVAPGMTSGVLSPGRVM